MKKITGGIIFIASVIGIIILFTTFLDEFLDEEPYYQTEAVLAWIACLLISISGIHYTLTSNFWQSKLSVLESINQENEIIKKQIEKRELLAKLENLEKK